jgi:hypothetical protein
VQIQSNGGREGYPVEKHLLLQECVHFSRDFRYKTGIAFSDIKKYMGTWTTAI